MYGGINGGGILPMTDAYLKKLVGDLGAKRAAVRNDATIALTLCDDSKVVTKLLEEVRKQSETRRLNSVIILGRKDDERIEPVLIKVLRTEHNDRIKVELCTALGNIGKTRESVGALLELIGNGNVELTVKAHSAIGKVRKRIDLTAERIDPPHSNWRKGPVTMDELNRRFDEINEKLEAAEIVLEEIRTDRNFMKNSSELLDKMRELSGKGTKAIKRAEKSLKRMKGKRARA